MTVTALVNLDRSTDLALTSVRARELRSLAERKLGEIQVFEKEFDDIKGLESSDAITDEIAIGHLQDLIDNVEAAKVTFARKDIHLYSPLKIQ